MEPGGKNIKFLVLDVDGVLTDGGMYYGPDGELMKKFHTRDGIAIRKLISQQMPVGILSSGLSNSKAIVEARAKVLGVTKVYVGEKAKLDVLSGWLPDMELDMGTTAYIGDGINDLAVIKAVGVSACPADAVWKVKDAVDVVLERKGGEGCVREFADRFLINSEQ